MTPLSKSYTKSPKGPLVLPEEDDEQCFAVVSDTGSKAVQVHTTRQALLRGSANINYRNYYIYKSLGFSNYFTYAKS